MKTDIRNSQGERIDYAYHPGQPENENLVVLGHGVTGNKDRPTLVAVAEALSERGLPALRLSFSGNGDSEGRFQESTISKEVADLGAVLDALVARHIAYIGHSMGAAVGTLRARDDDRIKILVSLAGMVHTRDFAEREFGDVTPDKGLMWDEPACPLSSVFMSDLRDIYSVADVAPEIRVPWLFVHGTEDDVVPIQDTEDIHGQANRGKALIRVEGADHLFSGDHLKPTADQVADWLVARFADL